MVVECINMAASNTLSTVNGHAVQRRGGSNPNVFLCHQVEQDLVRLHGGNCENKHPQSRAEFLSAKDASRRKRVNRSAKLKQCKLDARREQWLSQGSQGKQGKVEQQHEHHEQACDHHHKPVEVDFLSQERAGPSGHSRNQGSGFNATASERTPIGSPTMNLRLPTAGSSSERKSSNSKKEAPARRQDLSARAPKYFGDEEPHGGSEHNKQDTANGWSSSDVSKSRSNSSCASSSYTGSGSEDNDEPHEAEDDWEAAFDALHVQSSPHRSEGPHKGPSTDRALHGEGKELHDKKSSGVHHHPDLHSAQLKPEYKYKNSGFGGRRGNGGRAWRPDDVSRPPTLPRLTKQHTYPSHQNNNNNQGWGNMWSAPVTPSYCPICTEELDLTDSSYIPCSCGFQLCLFCYHRISSDDGRCPGCRKAYNPELAMKLSRSSSVWLRV